LNWICDSDECAAIREDCHADGVVSQIYAERVFVIVDPAVLHEPCRHRLKINTAHHCGENLNRVTSTECFGLPFAIALEPLKDMVVTAWTVVAGRSRLHAAIIACPWIYRVH
jgi:hypothetical protein